MPSESPCLIAIDQGTASSRGVTSTADGQAVASAQQEFAQRYPRDSLVQSERLGLVIGTYF